MKISDLPPFPPDIAEVYVAFGDITFLPDWEEIPQNYKDGIARGAKIAEVLCAGGWDFAAKIFPDLHNTSVDLAVPPSDHVYAVGEERDPVIRFKKIIDAISVSFQPKHQHKVAGIGYLIDLWAPEKTF